MNFRLYKFNQNGDVLGIIDSEAPSYCPFGENLCYARSVLSNDDSSYYIFGQSGEGSTGRFPFLIKYDTTGNLLWEKAYAPHPKSGNVDDAINTPNGDILLLSHYGYLADGHGFSARITKVNSDGEVIWDRDYNTGHRNTGSNARITVVDNNHYVLGWRMDIWPGWLDGEEYHWNAPLLIHMDSMGNVFRKDSFLINLDVQILYGLSTASNGDVLGTGEADLYSLTEESMDHYGGFIFRKDKEGKMLWHKRYLDLSHEAHRDMQLFDVTELPDGSIFAAGLRADTVGLGFLNTNAWVLSLDADGNCNDPEACAGLMIFDVPTSPVSVADLSDVEELSFYPNPASNRVYLQGLQDGYALIQLYDIQGKLVREYFSHGESAEIDISFLQSGMYFLNYISEDRVTVLRGKLMVK